MIGDTVAHYKILEKLGEGGMGVVYKAEDTKLDRTVALKFLPESLTPTEEDRRRFIREAKAAAALNHPNICSIYSIDEHDGRQFIEMEYIEGETLRAKIEAGDLELETALKYAVGIAGALSEAHQKEIIHRDIKPENIMVDNAGRIKVMDFGLAKLKHTKDITKTGSTVGTLAYMSPEQIQGKQVDHRSDIFSLGIVLYEMLTSSKPFRGEHEAAMTYAIVNEDPVPIRSHLSEFPEELERIFQRCLDKEPDQRYATAAGIREDLTKLQIGDKELLKISGQKDKDTATSASEPEKGGRDSTTVSITFPSGNFRLAAIGALLLLLIAIGVMIFYSPFVPRADPLPDRIPVAVTDFVNETGASELDGLSGMLITSLEQSNRLLVMPRSRMFDILDQQGTGEVSFIDESLGKKVARAADLRALVSASIHQFGEVYTIDLKILDIQRDEYLFTISEEGKGQESIPRMLDRLSEQIREDFRGPEVQEEMDPKPVAEMTTTNLEAYQYYFKGEELVNKLRFEEAAEQFRKAITLDPEFALAYYRLGYSLAWRGMEAGESYAKALEYIDRAPPKEQMMIRAVTAPERTTRIELLKKVLERYPQEKDALFILGDNYFHGGEVEESVQYFRKTLEIDPSFQPALQHIVWVLGILHDKREIEYAQMYVNEAPNTEAYYLLAGAHYYHGNTSKAFDTFRQGQVQFPEDAFLKGGSSLLYMYEDQFDKAAEIYRSLENSDRAEEREVGLRMAVAAYIYQGKISMALKTLEEIAALYRKSNNMIGLRRVYALQFKIVAAFLPDNNQLIEKYEQRVINNPPQEVYSHYNTNEAYLSLGELEKINNLNVIPGYAVYVDGVSAYVAEEFNKSLEKWKELEVLGYRRINAGSIMYRRAHAYMEMGKYNEAVELAEKITNNGQLHFLLEMNYLHMFWHPRNLYLIGQIYERKGEEARAMEYYNRFLELWKGADRNLVLLKEVKQRVANLQD